MSIENAYQVNIRRLLRHEIDVEIFIHKLRCLGYSDEEIDANIVACKHYAYPDIQHACKLFYEKLMFNRELTPMGFDAKHMLEHLPSISIPHRLTVKEILLNGVYSKI